MFSYQSALGERSDKFIEMCLSNHSSDKSINFLLAILALGDDLTDLGTDLYLLKKSLLGTPIIMIKHKLLAAGAQFKIVGAFILGVAGRLYRKIRPKVAL